MVKKMPAKDPETGKFVKSESKKEDELDYKKDIQDKSFADVATETPSQEETEKPEDKKPIEGEAIEVEPTKEDEIEFDPKKFKEEVVTEVSDKVSQATADKIAKTLTGKEEATQEERDKYEVYAEKFMAEKGRQPTWFEVAAFIKEEVKAEQKMEAEEKKKKEEEEKKQFEAVEKERTAAFNKYLDEQLEDLYKTGKLDKNNPEQRKALFQAMLTVNQDRVKQGLQPIYSIKEIFYEHYTPLNAQPAGDDAPVSAGMRSSGHASEDKENYSYSDIKKKSFMDIMLGK